MFAADISPVFEAALRGAISAEPRLLSDVIETLRDRGWRRVPRVYALELAIRNMDGVYVRSRTYAAGSAVYVATAPFTTVMTRHGVKEVG